MTTLRLIAPAHDAKQDVPLPSTIRIGVQLPEAGQVFVCETAPDTLRTAAAWRMLKPDARSAIIAQRNDQDGHAIDMLRVSVSSIAVVFGLEIRDLILRHIAALGVAA